jgi:hypothetical protein
MQMLVAPHCLAQTPDILAKGSYFARVWPKLAILNASLEIQITLLAGAIDRWWIVAFL